MTRAFLRCTVVLVLAMAAAIAPATAQLPPPPPTFAPPANPEEKAHAAGAKHCRQLERPTHTGGQSGALQIRTRR